MFRAMAIVTTATFTLSLATSIALRSPAPVGACTFQFPFFEERVAKASFVGVVRVEATGGAANAAPTATLRTPVWTPTSASVRSPTWTPTATSTPNPDLSLDGRGARVAVVQTIYGEAEAIFDLDTYARTQHEQAVRDVEAGVIDSCPVFTAAEYEAGGNYLLILARPDTGSETALRYRITGDAVQVDPPVYGGAFADHGMIRIAAPLYDRFFSRYAASDPYGPLPGFRDVDPQFVALADMLAAIDAIRSGATISPPDTGSAGLADPRLGGR